jgi:hypothetical protein
VVIFYQVIDNTMGDDSTKEGRPETTAEQKQEMLRKLEPYLKSGLSIRKSLREAQIPTSTFYDIMNRDVEFSEQINRFRQFVAVLLNSAVVKQLQDIIRKQSEGKGLEREDIEFLKWFANNSNLTREEFGERKDVALVDPEVELNKVMTLIEEQSTKENNNDNSK